MIHPLLSVPLAIVTILAFATNDLPAQLTMPAPADSQRVVQLHDALPLLDDGAIGGTIAGSPNSAAAQEEHRANREERMQAIASFARTFIEPPLAAEEDIAVLSGRYLVALARPQQQRWLKALLARNRQQGAHQIDLEIKLFRVPDKLFAAVTPPFGSDPPTKTQMGTTESGHLLALLDDTECSLILRAAEKLQSIEMLTAPRILVSPMSAANVAAGTQIPYVKDYAKTSPDDAMKPVHATLFDGIRLEAASGLIRENTLGLSFRFREQRVSLPIPKFTTTIGVANEVTVDLPASTVVQLEQQLELPNGQTAMFAAKQNEGPHLLFLVRARLVPNKTQGEAPMPKRR